jgi:hypothetical protein
VGREDDAGEGRGLSAELVAARWDSEYVAERPLPFVDRIISTLRAHPAAIDGVGVYVGCGNGRNCLPLVDAGLELTRFRLLVGPPADETVARKS